MNAGWMDIPLKVNFISSFEKPRIGPFLSFVNLVEW